MKKAYILDLIVIILLASALTLINETGIQIKTYYLFIPFLSCYFIGRYVSAYLQKR